MVKCPMCAEEVLEEAIKCKHCGSEIPSERLDQLKQEKVNEVMSTISYFSKPVTSGIAGILLIIGAFAGCVKVGSMDETAVSLWNNFSAIALIPAMLAFVQAFFWVMESKWKSIASGVCGFSVAVAMGAYLSYHIQKLGMADTVQSHWGAWVFGIGSIVLLFPLTDWTAEVEARITANK